MPAKRSAIARPGTLIIPYGGGGWKDSQVHYPLILPDPSDPTKLIMFMGGMAAPVSAGQSSIGRYTASKSDPYTWTPYAGNPIINDVNRLPDSVIYYGGVWYLYSTAVTLKHVDLFTSSDGFAFAKVGTVLTPTGQGRNDGDYVSQGYVYLEGSTLYMYYSYRNGGTVLPGFRLATGSVSDFSTFAKVGAGDIISNGSVAEPDHTYMEGCTVQKIGATYFMVASTYNALNGPDGKWTVSLYHSTAPDSGWVKSDCRPLLQGSTIVGAVDQLSIATGLLCQIGSIWYLFYQCSGGTGDYNANNWSMAVAALAGSPLDFL